MIFNHMPGIIGREKKRNKNKESLPIIKQKYIYRVPIYVGD